MEPFRSAAPATFNEVEAGWGASGGVAGIARRFASAPSTQGSPTASMIAPFHHPTWREDASLPGARVLIVEARFYEDLADELLRGAQRALAAAGAEADVLTVPGALEIPAALAIALDAAERAGRP